MEHISNSGELEAIMAGIEDEQELGCFDADGNRIDPDECWGEVIEVLEDA